MCTLCTQDDAILHPNNFKWTTKHTFICKTGTKKVGLDFSAFLTPTKPFQFNCMFSAYCVRMVLYVMYAAVSYDKYKRKLPKAMALVFCLTYIRMHLQNCLLWKLIEEVEKIELW